MATYYVKPTGSNAAAGTSTGTAWQTIAFALGATSGFASGDTLWVAAGTYRETVTVAMTSPTATTTIQGDTNGAIFGTAGECRITSFTTNDDSASAAATTFDTGGRNFLTFKYLKFEQGAASFHGFLSNNSTNITIDSCVFVTTGSSAALRVQGSAGQNTSSTVKNSVVIGRANALQVVGTAPASGDASIGITIQNCYVAVSSSNCIFINSTGTTGTISGLTITNCTCFGGSGGILVNTSAWRSTTASVTIRNCLMLAHTTALSANTSGQIDEDFNRLVCYSTARNLITAGANSIAAGVFGLDFDGGFITGASRHLHLMPNISGIVSGDGTATGAPATDIYGYTRPSPPSVGAAESNPLASTSSGGMLVHPGMAGGMRG